jgi:hypothetical protein
MPSWRRPSSSPPHCGSDHGGRRRGVHQVDVAFGGVLLAQGILDEGAGLLGFGTSPTRGSASCDAPKADSAASASPQATDLNVIDSRVTHRL